MEFVRPHQCICSADGAMCVQALFVRAQAPLKSVGMLCFMMWMSGSQLHIFSIMMTISGLYQPIMGIVKSREGDRGCLWVLKHAQRAAACAEF